MAKSESEKQKEDWMNTKWRPMMGWTYMATCLFDFILGPILYNVLQYLNPGQAVGMWTPLTLQGGGLYHLAMGAVLGLSAWGRTQEKLGGAVASSQVTPQAPVMVGAPSNTGGMSNGGFGTAPQPGGFGAPTATGFGGGGFGSTPSTAPAGGFGGNTGFGAPATGAIATTASGKKIVPEFDQPLL